MLIFVAFTELGILAWSVVSIFVAIKPKSSRTNSQLGSVQNYPFPLQPENSTSVIQTTNQTCYQWFTYSSYLQWTNLDQSVN